MEILKAYGVPVEIVDAVAVNMMHANTTEQILSPDGDIEFFEILTGVLQGDTLAPCLFIIALDYAVRQAIGNESNLGFALDRWRSRRHPPKTICDTDFADNAALLSRTLEQAQLLVSRGETSAKQNRLHITNSQTEYAKFNQGEGDPKVLNDQSLKNVGDFLYLESWIDCCSKDVNVRIGKAWCVHHKLDKIWKSELSGGLKIGFFRATVETILQYRSTAWTLTQSLVKKLDGAYTKMLRVVKNVTWPKRITNEVLYIGLPRISTTLRERSLRSSGYCWRSKNEVLTDLVLLGT